jgi:hypothetical protein
LATIKENIGMVYAVGVAGFIGGFLFGQMVLYFLLRHRSREELLQDKHLKLKYGILNWGIAAFGAWSFVRTYTFYFGG